MNNQAYCKFCGCAINWAKTKTGKFILLDLSGVPHLANCPDLKKPKKRPEIKNIEIERLGYLVWQTRIEWAKKQPNPKPSWLISWDEMSEAEREVDRLIGAKLAACGVAKQKTGVRSRNCNICERCFKDFNWQNSLYCIDCWIEKYKVEPATAERLRAGEYLNNYNCDDCKRTNQQYCNRCLD